MGGCCSTHQNNDHQTELETLRLQPPLAPHGRITIQQQNKIVGGTPPLSEAAVNQFLRKAKDGFEVLILLASGHGIECSVKVDAENRLVQISKGDLSKDISFDTITRVLTLPEELTKIRTEAKLDACCSALFSQHDSSCVVFCFDTPEENQAFVAAAYRFISNVSRRRPG